MSNDAGRGTGIGKVGQATSVCAELALIHTNPARPGLSWRQSTHNVLCLMISKVLMSSNTVKGWHLQLLLWEVVFA